MIKVYPFNFSNLVVKLSTISTILTISLFSALTVSAQENTGANNSAPTTPNPTAHLTPEQIAAIKAAKFAALPPIQQLGYRLKNASEEEKQQKAAGLAGLPFTASNILNTGVTNFYNEMYLRDFIQRNSLQNQLQKKLLCAPKFHLDGQIRNNVMLGAYRQQANLYDININFYHRYFKLGAGFTVGNYHYVVPTSPDLISKNYNKGLMLLAQADTYYDIALTYQLSYQFYKNKVNRQFKLYDKPYSFHDEYNQHDLTNTLVLSKNFSFNLIVPNQVVTPFIGFSYTNSQLPLVTEDLGGYRLEVAKQTVDHKEILTGFTYNYTVSNFNLVASYSFRYQFNDRKKLESKLTDDKTTIDLDFKKFDQKYEQAFGLKASYHYKVLTVGGQITLMNYVDFESSYGAFIKLNY